MPPPPLPRWSLRTPRADFVGTPSVAARAIAPPPMAAAGIRRAPLMAPASRAETAAVAMVTPRRRHAEGPTTVSALRRSHAHVHVVAPSFSNRLRTARAPSTAHVFRFLPGGEDTRRIRRLLYRRFFIIKKLLQFSKSIFFKYLFFFFTKVYPRTGHRRSSGR